MSEIREKIMAINWKSHTNVGELTSGYRVIWLDGFKSATRAAADIAEAEVQRLEAREAKLVDIVKELVGTDLWENGGKETLYRTIGGE